MCIVPPPADRSSLAAIGNLHQTFRGNLLTDTAIATSSGAKQGVLSARNRSRSDGALIASPDSDQQVTSAQLAQHSTEDDCWLVVKGKVSICFRYICLMKHRVLFSRSTCFAGLRCHRLD